MFSGESIEEVNAELDNLDREEEDYSKKKQQYKHINPKSIFIL